jgi:hypothetical protein
LTDSFENDLDESENDKRQVGSPRRIFIGRSLLDQYEDLPEEVTEYLKSIDKRTSKRNTRRHLFLGKRFFSNDAGKRNGIHRIFIGKRAGDIKRIFIG